MGKGVVKEQGLISVLIVTWNSDDQIGRCLESLGETEARSLQIIVVDNGSTDRTRERIQEFRDVQLVEIGTNLGFSPAMNLALMHSRGELVCLLNPDTRVDSHALDRLATCLESSELIMAVGPRILDVDGSVVSSCARSFPSLWEVFQRQFGIAKLLRNGFAAGRKLNVKVASGVACSVPCLTGAALMFRRRCLEEIGPLDETIPMYFEDLDYCARLSTYGSLFYVPDAVITHLGGQSSGRARQRSLLYAMEDGEAPSLYFSRYCGKASALTFRAFTFAGSVVRLAVLIPCCVVAACLSLEGKDTFDRIRLRAASLFWWSISSERCFRQHVRSFFGRYDSGPLAQ